MSEDALSRRSAPSERALAGLYAELATHSMRALWTVMDSFILPEPHSPALPALWSYAQLRALLLRAGELISAAEAERRVLILENPGLRRSSLVTRTLYCGLQLINPGEIAASHRHTQNALRFVLEGSGAHTVVDGEQVTMEPFDLVLTPDMTWHDHANPTDRHMIWLDGLDLGLVQSLDGAFSQRLQTAPAEPAPRLASASRRRWEQSMRSIGRPIPWAQPCHSMNWPAPAPPQFARARTLHYPYAKWRDALEHMRKLGEGDPHYGFKFEFVDPQDGAAVLQTISIFAQLIPAGMKTISCKSTDGTVYTVVDGSGCAWIADTRFELTPRSILIAPAWSALRFEASSDLVLFSYSDRVAQQALGLWRERSSRHETLQPAVGPEER